jgi:hypothetical protein
MYERLRDLPVLDSYPSRIPAPVWNAWRRYRARSHRERCFGLEGLPPLSLLLEEDAWVIVDSSLYDLPILAWTGFAEAEGRGLHEPVPCTVRHYHQGASKIRNQALALMQEELERRMKGGRAKL